MFLRADSYSKCLRKIVSFSAILPLDEPQKQQNPTQTGKLKTLYLLHGYSGNCVDWILKSRIQELSALHNLAVIMPSGDNSFYLDNDIGAYGEYVGKELVELTRSLFPLSDQREETLIGGLSMGGFGAVRNGLKYSETFGSIIALSSAFITDEVAENHGDMKGAPENKAYYVSVFGDPEKLIGSENDPKALAKKRKEADKPIPRIYMACGTEDFLLQQNRSFRDCLKDLKIDFTYEEAPGVHDWKFWNPHIEKALDWFDSHERPIRQ